MTPVPDLAVPGEPEADRARAATRAQGAPFGVYVHVPFCRHRCDYCAFATYTDRDHLMARYVSACVAELRAAMLAPATSVFFGGGTPSRLPAPELARILGAIERTEDAEVTVECNPEDATDALLEAYRRAGVNRMSFGVQSTAPHVLSALGRRHDPESVRLALERAARAGIRRVNVDLIYGAVGESDEDWARTIDEVVAASHPPTHVSAYGLTVEPGTPLAADPARHPDDDVQAARYEIADRMLSAAGYEWYEVSNWALPGEACRHNQLYWRQGDYRGIGSAAHSHQDGRRWWNVRTPDRYVALVEAGTDPVGGEERVEGDQAAMEGLMLALRTREGVPAAALPDDGRLEGLVVRDGDRAVLTLRGRLLANAVTALLRLPAPAAAYPAQP